LAILVPTSSDPMSPGPCVTATALTSSMEILAFSSAK